MNKKLIIGSVISVTIIGFWLSSKANQFVKNITYRFSNPRVSILNTNIKMDLKINNKNQFDMEVEGFNGRLLYGRNEIGTVTSGSLILEAMGSDVTEVTVDLKVIDMASGVIQMIESGNYLQKLKVKGIIRLKNPSSGITINVPYNENVI
jgi:LEA14-like dessication related protein